MSDTSQEPRVIILGDGSPLDLSLPNSNTHSETDADSEETGSTGSTDSGGSQTEEELEAEKEALRAELVPLTPEDQAKVDEVKAQEANAPPPTSANEAAYELADDSLAKDVKEFIKRADNEIHADFPCLTKFPVDAENTVRMLKISADDFKTKDGMPHAANDSFGEDYESYHSDWMKASVSRYDSIKVQKSVDKYGRRFYMFDDGTNVNLLIMVFRTPAGEMLCINDTILPLKEFLSITHAHPAKKPELKGEQPNLEIRRAFAPINDGDVLCKVGDSDEWFTIQNSTVNQIMTALLFLSKEKEEPANEVIPATAILKNTSSAWPGLIRILWRLLW